jgi:hypothetical protein
MVLGVMWRLTSVLQETPKDCWLLLMLAAGDWTVPLLTLQLSAQQMNTAAATAAAPAAAQQPSDAVTAAAGNGVAVALVSAANEAADGRGGPGAQGSSSVCPAKESQGPDSMQRACDPVAAGAGAAAGAAYGSGSLAERVETAACRTAGAPPLSAAGACFQVLLPHPITGAQPFVVLQQHFEAALQRRWHTGDKVQVRETRDK